MEMEKKCKIVQDLLPNYIEELTNYETNQFIEEHLKNCQECNSVYDVMKINANNSQEKEMKKKVDFFKKYNTKLKILKTLLFMTILLILLIFIIVIGKKMLILNSLQKKNEQYSTSNNLYMVVYHFFDDFIRIEEQYIKDNRIKIIETNIDKYGESKITYYINENNQNRYVDNWDGDKAVWLNENPKNLYGMSLAFSDEINNFKKLFNMALKVNIIEKKYEDSSDCYIIDIGEITEYIDRQTGLPLRIVNNNLNLNPNSNQTSKNICEIKYEFNQVNDSVFIEPDLSEYEIVTE